MPDRHLLYLIGQPGSGKSTLAAALTGGIEGVTYTEPFAHIDYPAATVIELGAHRDSFSGTDALPMNVQSKVIEWLQHWNGIGLILAEGDRLANRKFFCAAAEAGWRVQVGYLSLHASIADERRRARAAAVGVKPQNETWIKGRITKARTLAQEWPDVYLLNADLVPEMMAEQLRRYRDPVVEALDAARRQG